jgi:hypothetical protein
MGHRDERTQNYAQLTTDSPHQAGKYDEINTEVKKSWEGQWCVGWVEEGTNTYCFLLFCELFTLLKSTSILFFL